MVFTSNWVRYPIGIIVNVIVIRILGAEGKGAIALLLSLSGTLAALGHFGMPTAAIYYLRKNVFSIRKLSGNFVLVTIIYSLFVGLLFYYWIDYFLYRFLNQIDIDSITIWLVFIAVPITLLTNFLSAILLGSGLAKLYVKFIITSSLLNLGGILVFVWHFKFGVEGVVASFVFSNIFVLLLISIDLRKDLIWDVFQVRLNCLKQMLGYGLRQHISVLAALFFNHGSILLTGYYLAVSAVGYFAVGLSSYAIMISIPRAVNTLLIGEASSKLKKGSANIVAKSSRIIIAVMSIVVMVLAVLSYLWVPFLYGSDFTISIVPVVVLLCASIFTGITSSLQTFFNSINRPGLNSIVNILSALLALGLAFLLIPVAGINGMAYSILLAKVFGAGFSVFFFQKNSGIPFKSCLFLTGNDILEGRKIAKNLIHRFRFSIK